MALSKSKSRKCPVCVGCTPSKVKEVNQALEPVLADVKATGEIPKANDRRFDLVANAVGLAPHSLRFHLKECLLDLEIQDQRFQELVDLTEALKTAKQEYMANPSMQQATALTSILTQWRGLAEDIEGQQDPAVTVEFMVETVLGPLNRKVLVSMTEELKELRSSLEAFLPQNHRPYVDSQIKAVLSRVASTLRESTDESLKAMCDYYKVELEAQSRKRALDSTTPTSAPLFGSAGQSSEDDPAIH